MAFTGYVSSTRDMGWIKVPPLLLRWVPVGRLFMVLYSNHFWERVSQLTNIEKLSVGPSKLVVVCCLGSKVMFLAKRPFWRRRVVICKLRIEHI